jgi:adenylate cyclase
VGVERKLTAILCADVYGYSRLMGGDEEATLATLTAHRKIIDSLIERHHGRFVNSAGDSVLAEFASVVEAVNGAVDIQTALETENAKLPPERRMEFRIGVNLGDVMAEGDQIYGDGVNVAARLESLADPGGIYISDTVYQQVKSKLPLGWQDLGAQQVKNIAEPVRVFRVLMEPSAAAGTVTRRIAPNYWRAGALSIAGVAVILAVAVVLVQHLSLKPQPTHASIPPPQKPALPLPNIPSIAVLPFANLSNDSQQNYFSDGLTEDLITDLSKVPGLFVVSRNSVFTYKSKPERVEQIGRELGVRYVLEGSARKAGDQVRITAQLVDATNGFHIWADHYDQPLNNIFQVQDEIRQKIVFALKVKLSPEERERFKYAPTNSMEAYDLWLRAMPFMASFTKEGEREARRLCTQATVLDPNYSSAFWCLAQTSIIDWFWGWNVDPQEVDRVFALAQQAVALDDSSPLAHMGLGDAYKIKRLLDHAIAEGEKSVALGPSCGSCYGELAEHLMCAGRLAQALELLKKALRLDPAFYHADYQFDLAVVHLKMGKRDQATDELKQVLFHQPDFTFAHAILALIYAETGKEKEARTEASKWLKLVKPLTIAEVREWTRRNYVCADSAEWEHHLDTLQRLTTAAAQND